MKSKRTTTPASPAPRAAVKRGLADALPGLAGKGGRDRAGRHRRASGRVARLRRSLAAALLALPCVAAQEVPGLGRVDTRRPVPAGQPPWNAVGIVETTAENRCTGTLVGPRIVVTAAHCLVTADASGLVRPRAITFRIDGRSARGVALRSGPGFDPRREEPWRLDWAVVTIDAPLGNGRSLHMLQEPPREGLAVALAGWQHDRPGVLLADLGCHVGLFATFGRQGVMVGHNCAGTTGSSGAPLIARGPDGSFVVVAIQSKAALGQALGVAVPAFTIPLR